MPNKLPTLLAGSVYNSANGGYHNTLPKSGVQALSITFQPDTEARILASARAHGKTPDEVVASLLDLLPADEGEDDLLREIGFGFPAEFWSRYRTLAAQRQAEMLTPDEQAELISLSDQVEERTLRRTQALVELARQRNISLDTLIQQMGIHPMPVTS